jgi:putative oxidoreductase
MPSNRKWNIALWVAQVLLGLLFLIAGTSKLTQPLANLAAQMSWVNYYSESAVRLIGAAETAGALGLILPAATRILPILTPVAASGLALVMVLAAQFHATHGELGNIGANAVLGGLALFIAWGRVKKAPIAKRG